MNNSIHIRFVLFSRYFYAAKAIFSSKSMFLMRNIGDSNHLFIEMVLSLWFCFQIDWFLAMILMLLTQIMMLCQKIICKWMRYFQRIDFVHMANTRIWKTFMFVLFLVDSENKMIKTKKYEACIFHFSCYRDPNVHTNSPHNNLFIFKMNTSTRLSN